MSYKTLNPLTYQREIDCKKYIVTLFVAGDYLALGSDADYSHGRSPGFRHLFDK